MTVMWSPLVLVIVFRRVCGGVNDDNGIGEISLLDIAKSTFKCECHVFVYDKLLLWFAELFV